MNINYTESFNFKPIPSITPASDYWQNGTWKFNMPEITAGTNIVEITQASIDNLGLEVSFKQSTI